MAIVGLFQVTVYTEVNAAKYESTKSTFSSIKIVLGLHGKFW